MMVSRRMSLFFVLAENLSSDKPDRAGAVNTEELSAALHEKPCEAGLCEPLWENAVSSLRITRVPQLVLLLIAPL